MFDFNNKTVCLNSGYDMPILGLGTWTLNDEQAENSVYHALRDGCRLIDTARYYGNEAGVGKGIQKAINEGIVTREEVFVTSKIYGGNYERAGGKTKLGAISKTKSTRKRAFCFGGVAARSAAVTAIVMSDIFR